MGLLALWARQMEHNGILLAEVYLVSPDIWGCAEALPHWTVHFCSKCFLMLFAAFFSLLRVCCFFLKTEISVSCWAKCVLTTATHLWKKWRIISRWGFGVLLVRRILWYFTLALTFISNVKLRLTQKLFIPYLEKDRKVILKLCNIMP